MEQLSSSSKVTVEYFDPYGVYRFFVPSLLQRLPLQNLHWESHAGPLRSISTLHIDLIRSSETAEAAPSSLATHYPTKNDEPKVMSSEGSQIFLMGQVSERRQSQSGSLRPIVKERRHQIPGLRQTPYLKIFILRCDDVDTYRAVGRPQIKHWIKVHTLSTSNTSRFTAQENYDAFEWLIIHVTIPNTSVANHPRTSGKYSEGNSGLIKEKSTSRWRTGGSSTVLEKLRTDFNGSSKSNVDRIVQIRLTVDDVPHEMIPRTIPTISKSYVETPQENENAWQDLISKLKSLILTAFDMRVTQYEEDIREKDAQRSLPGWNFCTFFVLKEGLARGYESVGLVEDSLIEYDELAVGLDNIIREHVAKNKTEHGGSFLPYTSDLKRQAESAIAMISKDMGISNFVNTGTSFDLHSDSFSNEAYELPLNASKKHYRELILSNNISVFDFRCYLFSRQLNLLLRLANASSSKEEILSKVQEQIDSHSKNFTNKKISSKSSDQSENFAVLSKICRRAMEFIPSIARVMRTDLWTSHHHCWSRDSINCETSQTRMNQIMQQVTENIVSSFIFSTTHQILAQTSTKSLPVPPSTLNHLPSLDRRDSVSSISEPKLSAHPNRTSSLTIRSQTRYQTDQTSSPKTRRSSVPEDSSSSPSFLKIGLEELAVHRAELYLLSRNVLLRAGAQRGWSVGWSEMVKYQANGVGELEDIDLTQDSTKHLSTRSEPDSVPPSRHGIVSRLLRTGLSNKDDFYRLYETLSDKALRHYTAANSHHSVQSTMADLAVLKYHMKDYTAAATYLKRMISFYSEAGWMNIELSMLIIYAKCLQQLERREEYVQVAIKLLSKLAMSEYERSKWKSSVYWKTERFFDDYVQISENYLPRIYEITRTYNSPTYIPLQSFFGSIKVDETVIYHSERDSFELQLRLFYLLDDELLIDKIKVRISSITRGTNRDIWLETEGSFIFKKGINLISVGSNTTVLDFYLATCVVLSGNNLIHTYDSRDFNTPSFAGNRTFMLCPKLQIYQRPEVFDIKIHPSRFMNLGNTRSLELELSSGWNNVISGEIRIRAATAGLRLQTSDKKLTFGTITLLENQEAGIISFGSMPPHSLAIVAIPFSLEQDTPEILVKIDLTYTTEKGTFIYAAALPTSTLYPLGVNVQDSFKHNYLFSKFAISSATSGALRLIDCRLDKSEVFEAHSGPKMNTPLVIYSHQPATVVYKITRTKGSLKAYKLRKKEKSLSLILIFTCLEEEVIATITSNLTESLKNSSLRSFTRLIVGNVKNETRQHLSARDFERIALLGEISLSFLATVRWKEHFLGLGRCLHGEVADLIVEFIQEWLIRYPEIPLNMASNDDESFPKNRSILIPVDVPSIKVVHTADLKLLGLSMLHPEALRVAVNQPIRASLKIKWTRIWDTETPVHLSETNNINTSHQENSYEFSYEIFGPSDTWIIGGRRKSHFKVPKTIESSRDNTGSTSNRVGPFLTFPIILIPLRQGLLPYPSVDIKTVAALSSSSQPQPQMTVQNSSRASTFSSNSFPTHANLISQEPIVTWQTDHKNAVEFIHVVSDTQKITVGLDS